jgi:hypothetical protein
MAPEGQFMAENDPSFALVSFGGARSSWGKLNSNSKQLLNN